MGLSVLNNIASLTAQNNLAVTNNNLQNTLEQLSSGSRINSGADDPAGLSIADGLQANITALTQSAQNATNGIGQLQVADGALSQVTTLLNRAVTLATEAANGGLTTDQYGAITNEYSSILSEINRIGNATNFNGTAVFSAGNAANPNQYVTTNASNLSANTALTHNATTQVSVGGQTYTFTAGQNATTFVSGNTMAAASTIAVGDTLTLVNSATGSTGATYTAHALTETSAGVTNLGLGSSINTGDSISVSNALGTASFTYNASSVATVGEALNAFNNNTAGITATLSNSGVLTITSNSGITGFTASTTAVSDFGTFTAGTTDTVGDIINQINNNAGSDKMMAQLTSGGNLEITSSDGNLSVTNNMTDTLGTLQGTNTVQDLINGINGSGLGVTASLVNYTNPNELVSGSAVGSVTAGTAVAGSITISSGTEVNGVYPNTVTFNASTDTKDAVTGTDDLNTVQGLIDTINNSGSGFQAFINNGGQLEVTDGSYSGNIAVSSTTLTLGGDSAGFAAAGSVSQLEITDNLNRGNLNVTNTDTAFGYVDDTNNNPLEGGNPNSFIQAAQTSGGSQADIFISDGDVTNSNYNTIKVDIGALSTTQIGSNVTSLQNAVLGTATGAASALTVINEAISDVAAMRGTIGAGINRLNSATNVINTQVQNLTSAQSSIQDANVGQVVANLSKYQILEQTGISALAQANQSQQAVLKLLT